MYISKMALPRRTFLRGMGAALALPLLDAMVPALTPLAKAAAAPKIRAGWVYIPNGAIVDDFFPKSFGTGWEFTPILKPLEPHKDELVVVKNLTRSHPGSQVGDHAVSVGGYLTGVWPKRTEAEDVLANTTIDQIVARQIGEDTPLPSLEVATEDFTGYVGACSPGFSCAYMNTIAWSSPTTPLPMEINPRAVFEHLFGQAGTAAHRAARVKEEKSILDSISQEAGDLRRSLGAKDRGRVDQYLDNVREIERRIQRTEAHNATNVVTTGAPIGIPDSFEEHVGLMYDLIATAWQADITRVFTFMLSRELSQRTYGNIGVTEQHHTISHHGNDPDKIAKNVKINTYHIQLFARFIDKLKSIEDGDGTLLDHTVVFHGGGMGNPNGHLTDPLPVVGVGGGLGKGYRHLELPVRTPVGDLWLSVAHKFGNQMRQFGDGDAPISLFA
ncbi:MAG TPA: DUF1552 domain-containing protein [Vicinamibacterales bacterium]|nr:DUF1552 domain-containing protein [Vicinamibacterales bacterium]